MSWYTEEQLEEVMKYKAQKSSTMADNEEKNLVSILSMSDDLMKTIKNQQKHLWTDHKKKVTKISKNIINPKYDRHCYTERRNSPQRNILDDGLSEFNDSQSFVNDGNHLMKGIQKFKFLELNDLEKSEYIPMKKKLNPQQGTSTQKPNQTKHVKINNKISVNPVKTKNLQIQVDNQTPIKKQKSKILNHTKSSMTLTTPIKHFKKHILQAVEIKKQADQKTYCQTPKHKSIKQFYTQNTDHIPLYEKSKILSAKKLIALQQSRVMQQQAEIQEVTFWPMINSKSQQLIEGKSFYSRLEDTMNRKQTNQARIMYETMKPCTFVPKLNANKLTQSKVKKIWRDENDSSDFNDCNQYDLQQEVIREQDEFEIERNDLDERDWMTIKLDKSWGQKLFIN